ncbi:MAG: hypothetical protein AAFZ07_19965 [Actinomycetota bacterium]
MNARIRTSRVLALLIGVGAMLALAVGFSPSTGAAPVGWHEGSHTHRIIVTVTNGGTDKLDALVEVPFPTSPSNLLPETVRVTEVDSANPTTNNLVESDVPVQVDDDTVVFLVDGTFTGSTTKHFHVYFGSNRTQSPGFIDSPSADTKRPVDIALLTADNPANPYPDPVFRIETRAGTWFFEPNGGGFAGLVDADGNDWIGWDPSQRAEGGEFRGIPKARLDTANYGNDEGPFSPGSGDTDSRWEYEVNGGPVRVTFLSQSRNFATEEIDNEWTAQYEVGPRSMIFEMTDAPAAVPWRALYQGEPGGTLTDGDQVILSGQNGNAPTQLNTTNFSGASLGTPEWAAFLDGDTTRSLVIAASDNPEVDLSTTRTTDDGSTTIFGFGRSSSAQTSHELIGTGDVFAYGLVDSTTAGTLNTRANDLRGGVIDGTDGTTVTAAAVEVNSDVDDPGATTTSTVTVPPTIPPAPLEGYRLLDRNGEVYTFGEATDLGDARQTRAGAAVDIESTPSNRGYWILDETGKVEAFGDAIDHGSLSDTSVVLSPGETVSTMSRTIDGGGYWLFTSIGRAIGFGNAGDFSDLVEQGLAGQLNGPIIDSVSTATGAGYWMVGSDGGVFSFGDAQFFGSMGGQAINQPVNGLVPDPDGAGYWLVAGDGGVFAFQADFVGSVPGELAPGVSLNAPVIGMVSYGNGYLMVASDGGVFNFSDLPFDGSLGGNPPSVPVVAISA